MSPVRNLNPVTPSDPILDAIVAETITQILTLSSQTEIGEEFEITADLSNHHNRNIAITVDLLVWRVKSVVSGPNSDIIFVGGGGAFMKFKRVK